MNKLSTCCTNQLSIDLSKYLWIKTWSGGLYKIWLCDEKRKHGYVWYADRKIWYKNRLDWEKKMQCVRNTISGIV